MHLQILLNTLFLITIAACQGDNVQVLDHENAEQLFARKDYVSANHLYAASELMEILNKEPETIIFEVSKAEVYDNGHIPGAYQIWRPDFATKNNHAVSGMRATKAELSELLSHFGVKPETKILIYDNRANVEALRFLWLLKMYGHQHLMIINGSKKAWIDAGFPLETKRNTPGLRTDYQFLNKTDSSLLAAYSDVLQVISDTNTILVDTREPYEYDGKPFIKDGQVNKFKPGAFSAGRISNARHLNWSSTVDLSGDHRFKSLRDLEYDIKKVGLNKDKQIIVYCHSGTRSAHTAYVLKEILGFPNVRNYDGSWIEWSYLQKDMALPAIEKLTDEQQTSILDSLKTQIIN